MGGFLRRKARPPSDGQQGFGPPAMGDWVVRLCIHGRTTPLSYSMEVDELEEPGERTIRAGRSFDEFDDVASGLASRPRSTTIAAPEGRPTWFVTNSSG
jgi:hypothetical protein